LSFEELFSNAPVNGSYAKIYANNHAFAALKADGTIVAWGKKGFGGTTAPAGNGYTKIKAPFVE
jgi:hypothetical protein